MTNAARYITGTEQAKMIRTSLREAFPATTFTVRQSRGSAITVAWADGPTVKQVDALVQRFAGGGFEASLDLGYSVQSYVKGEPVLFGQHFIFANRRLSLAFASRYLARASAYYGFNADAFALRGDGERGYRIDASDTRLVGWDAIALVARKVDAYSHEAAKDSPTARQTGTHAEVPSYIQRGE
ncbi:MAG: hypothetical protein H0U69_03635 [Trueperaceae bacterium]|nr:hypothetical protein [Trueperaceae bacterium]